MARSDENLPLRAVLRMDIRVQSLYVLPGRINLFLTRDVVSVIGQHEERIIMDQVIDQWAKYFGIASREIFLYR